ncbi:MAG: hypothetical protein A2Y79_09495 [Deltaproteobacteria bacterium RBG_13_43_22]|nr:MAG: hypothetical protein A2Y79_09495 [Deltaproteobacteria bacterium RBG_13_43_22]
MAHSPKTTSWMLILLLLAVLIIPTVLYLRTPRPCQEPITYRLGKVDERFDLTREEFGTAVNMAAAMWGKPVSRDLFREDPQGNIEVNLVYDYRQEATDRLKSLNIKIDRSKNSCEELKARLDSLKMEYEQKNAALGGDLTVYHSRTNAFNKEAESWNRSGGVSENVHSRLMKEKSELNNLRDHLHGRQEEMKRLMETINSLVVVINEVASNYNLDLVDHQNIGQAIGREFCEGNYENKKGRQSITIFQFDNDYRLVRVLAHEFGHALGLDHSQNEDAVMYRLIKSNTLELASDDVATLKNRCKIQ